MKFRSLILTLHLMVYRSKFDLQPFLENTAVSIRPLQQDDWEIVYALASDPLIWEQHPQKDRYKKEVFELYFKSAIESKGAFLVSDAKTKRPIGCTRYYDLNEKLRSVAIGYTFLTRDHWGATYNSALKSLMINYAFRFVDTIIFHVGIHNIRSQKAVEKLGAKNIRTEDIVYPGQLSNPNFVYELKRVYWI
jgi:RimJ/RimL family protein N-acetyltransferase